MERLTKRVEDGGAVYHLYGFGAFDEMEALGECVGRLAAYEDTGLEPEEIRSLKTALEELSQKVDGILDNQKFVQMLKEHGIDVDAGIRHMEDIIQAEKDGQLVVLPF